LCLAFDAARADPYKEGVMKLRCILCGLVFLLGNVGVHAETVIWFVDGRTLSVESISFADDLATLTFEKGSQLLVPASRIERFLKAPALPPVAAKTRLPANESWTQLAGPYAETIRRAAQRHGVDPVLLAAMAKVESGFDPRAVSHKGAQGLLQLMPDTARRFGVSDSFDPDQNLNGGARYLDWLLTRFSGDERLALAGYNAGEGAVDRYKGIPPFPETQKYVGRVLGHVETLRAGSIVAN
jgi:soluble lytic murein transglycosylase-like protein